MNSGTVAWYSDPTRILTSTVQNSKETHLPTYQRWKKAERKIRNHNHYTREVLNKNINFPAYRPHRCRFRQPWSSDSAFDDCVLALRRCACNSFHRRSPWCRIAENLRPWWLLRSVKLSLSKNVKNSQITSKIYTKFQFQHSNWLFTTYQCANMKYFFNFRLFCTTCTHVI